MNGIPENIAQGLNIARIRGRGMSAIFGPNETTSGTFLVVNERRLSNIIIITFYTKKIGKNK